MDSNLVPTPIVNARGVSTTVYRKPSPVATDSNKDIPAVTSNITKPRSNKALITDAAIGLGMSKSMAKRLSQKSEELDPTAQAAMFNLMTQVDPHATVSKLILDKFGKDYPALRPEGDDGYKHADIAKFETWVKHADHHLHAVDTLIRKLHPAGLSHRFTDLVIAGLHLQEHQNFTTDQYRDIALVTAAASVWRIKHRSHEYDLTTLEFMSAKNYEHLNSDLVIERITFSHDVAEEALRLITEENVLTNAELLHRLDGTPRALISGTI